MRPGPSPPALAAILVPLNLFPAGCGSLIVTQKSVESLAGRRGFTWTTVATDGFVIYVEPGSASAARTEGITAAAVTGRRQVLEYLDVEAYEPTISIFAVDDRDRMNDLIGRRTNATGYHTSSTLCVAWLKSGRSGVTHEMLHVVAMNLWGVPERWVNEGMAVDATGPWRGQDVHAVCKVLRERGELPSLDDVTRRFGGLPSLVSYPAAGSFVRYLRETHGMDALRLVWDGGRRALTQTTDRTPADLEAAWLTVIDRAEATGVEYETSD